MRLGRGIRRRLVRDRDRRERDVDLTPPQPAGRRDPENRRRSVRRTSPAGQQHLTNPQRQVQRPVNLPLLVPISHPTSTSHPHPQPPQRLPPATNERGYTAAAVRAGDYYPFVRTAATRPRVGESLSGFGLTAGFGSPMVAEHALESPFQGLVREARGTVSERRVGIVMNGVTGRMGLRQHLERSIVAIREQGGIPAADGTMIIPDPILVGRNELKLRRIAEHLRADPLDHRPVRGAGASRMSRSTSTRSSPSCARRGSAPRSRPARRSTARSRSRRASTRRSTWPSWSATPGSRTASSRTSCRCPACGS